MLDTGDQPCVTYSGVSGDTLTSTVKLHLGRKQMENAYLINKGRRIAEQISMATVRARIVSKRNVAIPIGFVFVVEF